jgi:hypothetical protein
MMLPCESNQYDTHSLFSNTQLPPPTSHMHTLTQSGFINIKSNYPGSFAVSFLEHINEYCHENHPKHTYSKYVDVSCNDICFTCHDLSKSNFYHPSIRCSAYQNIVSDWTINNMTWTKIVHKFVPCENLKPHESDSLRRRFSFSLLWAWRWCNQSNMVGEDGLEIQNFRNSLSHISPFHALCMSLKALYIFGLTEVPKSCGCTQKGSKQSLRLHNGIMAPSNVDKIDRIEQHETAYINEMGIRWRSRCFFVWNAFICFCPKNPLSFDLRYSLCE